MIKRSNLFLNLVQVLRNGICSLVVFSTKIYFNHQLKITKLLSVDLEFSHTNIMLHE